MKEHNPSLEEDQRLVSGCCSGDRKASETFVRQFSDLVYKSVQHTLITRQVHFNREDLEDLHNTVFLQLFEKGRKKLKQYEGRNGCSLASWIRIVAVRIVLNHLRKKGLDALVSQKRRVSLGDLPELKGEGMEPGTIIEKEEKEQLLQDGIRNLSPRDRLFMRLHLEMGLSLEEVAEAMEITIENAYSVKHRAIQRLKSYIHQKQKNEPRVQENQKDCV